jgi:hypothetical protein
VCSQYLFVCPELMSYDIVIKVMQTRDTISLLWMSHHSVKSLNFETIIIFIFWFVRKFGIILSVGVLGILCLMSNIWCYDFVCISHSSVSDFVLYLFVLSYLAVQLNILLCLCDNMQHKYFFQILSTECFEPTVVVLMSNDKCR